jgi:uncharacterized membrane protein (UPF0127 family)
MTKHGFKRSYWGPLSQYSFFALFLLLLLFFSASEAADKTSATDGAKKISIQRGTEQIAVFAVETVSEQKAMQKGLAERLSICDDCGMLFILDGSRTHFFWMKGMEFGLDILFFSKDKTLIEIMPGLLPCVSCMKHKAPEGTAYALEINAGMVDIFGIKRGDRLVYTDK